MYLKLRLVVVVGIVIGHRCHSFLLILLAIVSIHRFSSISETSFFYFYHFSFLFSFLISHFFFVHESMTKFMWPVMKLLFLVYGYFGTTMSETMMFHCLNDFRVWNIHFGNKNERSSILYGWSSYACHQLLKTINIYESSSIGQRGPIVSFGHRAIGPSKYMNFFIDDDY